MTRKSDTLIALGDRGRIANQAKGDLFMSIHVNAANPRWKQPGAARGFETYFLAEAKTEDERRVEAMENEVIKFETDGGHHGRRSAGFIIRDMAQNEHLRESSRLADLVQAGLGSIHPGPGRGVKQAGFRVLVNAFMPAVLVEIGFGTQSRGIDVTCPMPEQPARARRDARRCGRGISRAVRAQGRGRVLMATRRWPRQAGAALLVAGRVAVAGCVYFNGIYNANEAARNGDARLRQGAETEAAAFFQASAAKAETVLVRHPKSSRRTQALYLAGRGAAWSGQCETAEARLVEFLAVTEGSTGDRERDLERARDRDRARLAKAACELRLARIPAARARLDSLVDAPDPEIAQPGAILGGARGPGGGRS